MNNSKYTVAIVGSVRSKIVNDEEKQKNAKNACFELGSELANAGFKIAVYTSNTDFIEQFIVSGYIKSGKAAPKSIFCYYPFGAEVKFAEMDAAEAKNCFEEKTDASNNWEVSFYRSLTKVDGIIVIGGGSSTLTSGQIAFSRNIPIVTIPLFGGAAFELWKDIGNQKFDFLDADDIALMAKRWDDTAAKNLTSVLSRQLEKVDRMKVGIEKDISILKEKAGKWDNYITEKRHEKEAIILAGIFLVLFVIFLIIGLIISPNSVIYSLMSIIGLCIAGGVGSTVRMLTPQSPKSQIGKVLLLGIVVGLVFSLLYLLPQLIQGSGFLIVDDTAKIVTSTIRVQYITSMIVSFMAGLSFEVAIQQLIKKSEETQKEITNTKV